MGPTNVALVKLFQADMKLREAQARLDSASRDIRIQERRVNDLNEKLALAQRTLRESQAKAGGLDLDLKTRDTHIERLRTQQQTTHNSREYQAFLVEINTQKVDREKVEEETLAVMEAVEKQQAETTALASSLATEQAKLAEMKTASETKLKELQADVEAVRPAREAAYAAIPIKARDPYDRLAGRFEGEALSAVTKPDRRREEYACGACNMDLVTDTYNKLHSRDEMIFCPSCKRILYIPDDLPPEMAIGAGPKAPTKAAAAKGPKEPGAPKTPRTAKPRKAAARPPKISAQQAIEKFLAWYPQGFNTPAYLDKHRVPRADAAQTWNVELGGGKAEQLLAEGAIGELIRKSDLVIGELTYLNRNERVALRDVLNEEASLREIYGAMLPLLAESTPTAAAFATYASALRALPQRGEKVGGWSPLTLLPALARPDRLLFVRPDAVAQAAARAGIGDLDLNAGPNWPAYEKVLALAETTLSQLRPHGAQDRLDVWAFFAIVSEYDAAPLAEDANAPAREKTSASDTASPSEASTTDTAAPEASAPSALPATTLAPSTSSPASTQHDASGEERSADSDIPENVASR